MRISDWSSDVCSSDLDHAIFVIYSLDFMTLLVIALSLLGAIGLGSDLIAFAAMLLPPIHIYKQLRGAYELRRFSALWRTFVLLVFALIALVFFLMMMLGMGLLGCRRISRLCSPCQ